MTELSGRRATGWGVRTYGLLALFAALLIGLVGFVPAAASASPVLPGAEPHGESAVRALIAGSALGEVGKGESGGENYYPKKYKISKKIVRPAEWCGVFTNWAWYAGGVAARPPATGKNENQLHWATYWQKWGQKHKKWHKASQRKVDIGDAVVYGNFPQSGHIGVVVGVKYDKKKRATWVMTVEGNVGDKVTNKGWRKIGNLTGRGYKASGFVSPF